MGVMLKILFFVVPFFAGIAFSQSPDEIIQKAEDRLRGTTSISTMTITTVRPKWKRVMEVKNWSDGYDFSATLVLSPAKDKGSVYLKRYNEIWNYVPSIERTVKMPPSAMSQSWMGTDLTNDDLVRETSLKDDFDKKITGSETLEGYECHVIELTPKKDVLAIWGKVIIWISKKEYLQLKTEFYDEDNKLINTIVSREIKDMGGKLMPTVMVVIPADKKGHKTIMRYTSIEFDVEIPPETFTTQYMKRLK